MAKVVIATGSARKGSNSTILAKAFAEGATAAGHEVSFFSTTDKKISGCVACKDCWSTGIPCIHDKNFAEYGKLMEAADVVVFATPVYWGSYSSQMKALIDKFFAYGIRRTKVDIRGNKKAVLLATGDGKKETAFEIIKEQFTGLAEFQQWEIGGIITAPELVDEEEILGKPEIEEAKALGKAIV